MKRREFRELILHLEALASRAPSSYRLRLTALAMLGYLYLLLVFGVLIGILGFVGTVVWVVLVNGKAGFLALQLLVKLGVPAAMLAYFVLKAFWVKIPPPDGRTLNQHEAPALFQLIEEVRSSLDSPKIHEIILTHEFNAGIFQWPRLGVLGWSKNYLLLGFPLMACLTPQQFKGVLAHEFGHLSGKHGSFNAWIYRLRTTWGQLLTALANEQSEGGWLFNRFINWFAPYFDAYAFVIGREHEFEADRLSESVVGRETAKQALMATTVMARFLDEDYWPSLNRASSQQAEPPRDVYSGLLKHVGSGIDLEKAQCWLEEALQLKTDIDDTHPALADRLAALDVSRASGFTDRMLPALRLRKTSEASAGDVFLEGFMQSWGRELDSAWFQAVTPTWKEVFGEAQAEIAELNELREKSFEETLSQDDAWKLVTWTGRHQGDTMARPLLVEFLRNHPDHAAANFTYGRILLEERDERGEECIVRAMDNSHELVIPGCEALAVFYHLLGRDDHAEQFRERIEAQTELYQQAQAERNEIKPTDKLFPHGLAEDVISTIESIFSQHPEIAEGYVVRKEVQHFPDDPCFLVGVLAKRSWFSLSMKNDDEKNLEMVQSLANQIQLPGQFIVFVIEKELKPLHEQLLKLGNSRVHPAP